MYAEMPSSSRSGPAMTASVCSCCAGGPNVDSPQALLFLRRCSVSRHRRRSTGPPAFYPPWPGSPLPAGGPGRMARERHPHIYKRHRRQPAGKTRGYPCALRASQEPSGDAEPTILDGVIRRRAVGACFRCIRTTRCRCDQNHAWMRGNAVACVASRAPVIRLAGCSDWLTTPSKLYQFEQLEPFCAGIPLL